MNRRDFIKAAGCTAAALMLPGCNEQPAGASAAANKQPLNILIITADDMNCDSIGVYGCPVPGTTPNLDRFARESVRFERAHVNIAVCMPCRFSVMSGLYPHRSGSEGFDYVRDDVPILPETFRNAGYLVGVIGKAHHTEGKADTYFDLKKDMGDLGLGRDPQKYYEYSTAFFRQAREENRPFFFVANSHDPHRPFHGSAQETHVPRMKDNLHERPNPSKIFKPDEIVVPEFLPDIPDVRLEMSQYYSSVRRCDDTLGRVLDALDENGFRDNTLVVFFSDHGISMPFAKTNCYLNSTKTPLMVRWPGVTRPGKVDRDHLLAGIDITPTLLEAAGLSRYETMDGRSFVPLLKGKSYQPGGLIFTQFHETSARKRFPMRCVQDKKYGYIFNPWSDGETAFQNEAQSGLTWKAMTEAAADNPAVAARVKFYAYRVLEEFYDLESDPDCLHNLIDDPRYKKQIDLKRAQLREWMVRTQDRALLAFGSEEGRRDFLAAERAHARKRKAEIQARRNKQQPDTDDDSE